jgi:hypothetical protein
MVQPRRDLDLPEEPVGTQGGRQLGLQDLDRDGAVVLEILAR